MRRIAPKLRPLPLLGLLLAAGCDREPAELIQEVNAAREGCTEEKLKAGAEECVRMMERYAEMGTEVIEGYIGAVKSLDQALRRMPPAQFDTAGVGHAITPDAAPAWEDTSAAARGLFPTGPAFSRPGDGRATGREWGSPAYPVDPWPGAAPGYGADPRDPDGAGRYGPDPRYGDPRYSDPGYGDPRYGDPRSGDPRYGDPRYADPQYGDPRYRDAYGDPYPADRYDRRGEAGDPDRRDAREGRWDRRPVDPRAAPPARGRLLPPEERLRRPWLEEEPSPRSGGRRVPSAEWRDTVVRRR